MRLKKIAKIINGTLYGKDIDIKNVLPPEEADRHSLTFLFDPRTKTSARAVIAQQRVAGKISIVVKDSKKAMYLLLKQISRTKTKPHIAQQTRIEKNVHIPESCTIESYTIIKQGAKIGTGCFIGSGVYIDKNVVIGDYCTIEHHAVIYENTRIGNYVCIGANSVIGKEGFGYIKSRTYKRIKHIGGVIIQNFVEIGGNVTIDRATIGNTIIGRGTKIDNLVHIAHNVHIGKNCLVMGQAGIAGSTNIGDNVILCGQSGVSDHLTIGNNVVIYAKSAVFSNLAPDKKYSGIPAREHYIVLKALARLYRNL